MRGVDDVMVGPATGTVANHLMCFHWCTGTKTRFGVLDMMTRGGKLRSSRAAATVLLLPLFDTACTMQPMSCEGPLPAGWKRRTTADGSAYFVKCVP